MKKSIEDYISILNTSQNEDEVLTTLKKIVKTFSVDIYRELIMSNPYFKSLIPDIKSEVIDEMSTMKSTIKDEIYNLDKELIKSMSQSDFLKLKGLKRECIYLLNELENRRIDLDNLD